MPDQWKEERPADRPWRGGVNRARKRESERRRKRNSPMVLPYGKSPTAMVNAHVIGGRYTGIITGSQKVTMNYSKFALQPQYAKNSLRAFSFSRSSDRNNGQ